MPQLQLEVSIKKFLLGICVALGILFAYYAYAHTSSFPVYATVDYQANTIFNTPGIPDYDAYLQWERSSTHQTQSHVSYSVRCSCVLYAKSLTGYNQSVGLAKNWPVNSTVPTLGAVVVFGGAIGHVGVIAEIGSGEFRLDESNYSRCQIMHDRWVSSLDSRILGYWVP